MKIIDAKYDTNPTPAKIPEKGFYVDLDWMYGDADGDASTTVGPFPEKYKHLYIEFLNLLQDMEELYADTGMGGDDDYRGVANYHKYFDRDLGDETDEDKFLTYLGIEMEYCPDGWGSAAELMGYRCYYHDGTTIDKYNVSLTTED